MSSVDSSDSEFGTIDLRGAFYVIELKISQWLKVFPNFKNLTITQVITRVHVYAKGSLSARYLGVGETCLLVFTLLQLLLFPFYRICNVTRERIQIIQKT
jgi:hypothetical protein